jgi:poly-gamma-glutamate synthesis protein (capsule biosynthesis protein)
MEYTQILTSNSVEACSLGNNHIVDYGEEGTADTKSCLEEAGIAYAYNDIIAYHTTEEGLVIAIVSASMIYEPDDKQYVLDGVKEARAKGVDLVIACCHWGKELHHYPEDDQIELGHALIDAGADLVVGNHSHCLQGMEAYKGRIICYSLGNFSFGGNRNPRIKDTAVFQQEFTFIDDILQADVTARIIPTRISEYSNYNNYKPIIAEGKAAERIIQDMNSYSEPFESITFDEDGTLELLE